MTSKIIPGIKNKERRKRDRKRREWEREKEKTQDKMFVGEKSKDL